MRNRKDILLDLINYNGNISDLQKELSFYEWDIDEPLLTVSKWHVLNLFDKFLRGDVNVTDLEEWANIIECWEDLFLEEELKQVIDEIANPALYGELNTGGIVDYKKNFKSNE